MSIPKVITKLLNKYGVYSGNASTPLELSTFVRPTSEVKCNGFDFKPGHLRNFDFNMFRRYPKAQRLIMSNTPDQKCVVYLWRRWVNESTGNRHPIVYGFTIATPDNVIIKRVVMGQYGRYHTIIRALEAAAKLTG